MARTLHHPNWLLVEGDDDKRVIPWLMDCFIEWGDDPADWPCCIEEFGGYGPLLKDGEIQTQLKRGGLKTLGILVDANDDPAGRWNAIRQRCIADFPTFPAAVVPTGLNISNAAGLRLGVWLMPDNGSKGMMETFLALFVPPAGSALWTFAEQCCTDCKAHAAPYKNAHLDKARIHTWLAWQDPPGRPLHNAIIEQMLKPGSPQADQFVNWFCNLFGCSRRPPATAVLAAGT